MAEPYEPFTILGIILIIMGIILVALPFLARYTPVLERLPPILIYVYRHNGFYFVTSPILIIISIISIIIFLIKRLL